MIKYGIIDTTKDAKITLIKSGKKQTKIYKKNSIANNIQYNVT